MRLQSDNKLATPRQLQRGFTLIEMLVIAPIVLIVIGVLVSAMVSMVGDAMVANARVSVAYNIRDALTRIEEDTRVSINFMPSFSFFQAPQGRDDNTAPFSSASGDLILTQQATTKSPYNGERDLVYYADQPNACGRPETRGNRILLNRVIYFTKDSGSGSKTLWRRVIVREWDKTGSGMNTVCDTPWQRDTCAPGKSGGRCKATDEIMLDGVTAFELTYRTATGTTTTDPTVATTVAIKLATANKVAGKNITQSATVQVTRTNDVPTPPSPAAPTISLYNEGIAVDNNPMKASFQWSSSSAFGYSYSIRTNGGDWSTPVFTRATNGSFNTPGPNQTISIRVVAYNDTGPSPETQFDTSTSPSAVMNLENAWECSGQHYTCPSFSRSSAGVVTLSGLAKNGTGKITTLPEKFRPKKRIIFMTLAHNNVPARVDVEPNGAVSWMSGGSNTWLSLDSIQFMAADYPTTWTAPTLLCPTGCATPWTHYGGGTGGYGRLEFTKDSMGRSHLYGLLSAPSPYPPTLGSPVATIPTSPSYVPPSGSYDIYPSGSANQFSTMGMNGSQILFRTGVSTWQSYALMYHSATSTATWTEPALNGGWANYGDSSFSRASFTRAADGIVTLRGLIKSGDTAQGAVLFTLPSGSRPKNRLVFLSSGVSTAAGRPQVAARIDIAANGDVILQSTTGTLSSNWLSLGGINFVAEQ